MSEIKLIASSYCSTVGATNPVRKPDRLASSFQKRTNEQKMSHKYSQTVTTPVYDKELTSDRREIVYTLVVVGIRKVISVNIAYISLA